MPKDKCEKNKGTKKHPKLNFELSLLVIAYGIWKSHLKSFSFHQRFGGKFGGIFESVIPHLQRHTNSNHSKRDINQL